MLEIKKTIKVVMSIDIDAIPTNPMLFEYTESPQHIVINKTNKKTANNIFLANPLPIYQLKLFHL